MDTVRFINLLLLPIQYVYCIQMSQILEGKDAKNHYSGFYTVIYNLHKWLWDFITFNKSEKALKLFLKGNINHSTRILDLGCGTGNNLMNIIKLKLGFKYYRGVDISADMLKVARKRFLYLIYQKNADFIKGDIRNPVNSFEEFDVILCTWVFSHIKKPDELVAKFHKAIKKNGKIYLIFLSEPKWFMRLLFYPIEKIFKTRYTDEKEIKKFGNVIRRDSYFANLITALEIEK